MENKSFTPTAEGLVEYVLKMKDVPHIYLWGGIGQYLTTELIEELAEQFPDWYTPEKKAVRLTLADKGIRGWDCFGLFRSYVWNDYHQGNTEYFFKELDYSTHVLIEAAEVKGPIEEMPDKPGIILWKKGHVGVYIGNGEVLEMTASHKADITKLIGGIQIRTVEEGGWTNWLQCPYVQY